MELPTATNKQIEIINLIYKYRYLNRIQIQSFLNHKNKKNINTWLKDLTEKQFLNRIYSNTIGNNTKPAIYYAGINAIRYYKTKEGYSAAYLKNLYRDNERSRNFIDEQILLVDICLDLLSINTKGEIHYEFAVAADVTSNSPYHFMGELSPQLIFTKKTKEEFRQYILVMLDDSSPSYMIKKKMKNYIEFFFTNEWEENTSQPFPTILFACETLPLMISAKRTIKKLLDDYQNPENLEIWFGTYEDLRESGITAEIWEDRKDR